MILIDANIPMYIMGHDDRRKADAQVALERAASVRARLVTDVEVFQEILHRYRAIDRPSAIQGAFDLLLALVDEVFAVTFEDVDEARGVMLGYPKLAARNALHVTVMRRRGISEILTFDRGFDGVPGIERIG